MNVKYLVKFSGGTFHIRQFLKSHGFRYRPIKGNHSIWQKVFDVGEEVDDFLELEEVQGLEVEVLQIQPPKRIVIKDPEFIKALFGD